MKYIDDEKLTQLTHDLTDVLCGSSRVINGQIESYTMKRCGHDKKYAQGLSDKFNHQFGIIDRSSGIKSTKACALIHPKSTLGDFQSTEARRLMTDLILTLNASFPDYDFGSFKPDHFRRIDSPGEAFETANKFLSELSLHKPSGFLQNMWRSIDEAIILKDCEIYKFVQDDVILSGAERERDTDPFFADACASHEYSASPSCVGHIYYDTCKSSSMTVMDSSSGERIDGEVGAPLWSFNYFFVNKHQKRILFFTCTQSCVKEEYNHENLSCDHYDDYEESGVFSHIKLNDLTEEDDADYGSCNFDMDVEDLETVEGVSVAI